MTSTKEQVAELRRIANHLKSQEVDFLPDKLEQAADTIERLSDDEHSSPCGDWIPCSKQLPDNSETVLIWHKHGKEAPWYYISCQYLGKWVCRSDVLAWASLPKSPKECNGDEWKMCSKELPESGKLVLTWRKFGGADDYHLSELRAGEWKCPGKVLAWTYLPKPPKE